MNNFLLEVPLLSYQSELKIQNTTEGKRQVYDPVRRQFVAFLPEEMVRQLWLLHLSKAIGYPLGKIAVEQSLKVHQRQKRCDVLVYNSLFQPWLLLECKAPSVPIDQSVFEQIAIYNIPLKVPYLLVSNGIHTYSCRLNEAQDNYDFLTDLPMYI